MPARKINVRLNQSSQQVQPIRLLKGFCGIQSFCMYVSFRGSIEIFAGDETWWSGRGGKERAGITRELEYQ